MYWTLTFLVSFIAVAQGRYGADMSQEICADTDLSDFECLKNHGYDFAIIQTWQGGYQLNTDIGKCVDNAWHAGMAHVDVYAFMCPNCDGNYPASSAIDTIVNYLHGHNVQYGMLWIDVEQCDGCWYGDLGSNCDYVVEAASHARGLGVNVGIYSSEGEWSATVGSDCNRLTSYPLWYAHYDGEPNFNDQWAYEFGGWSKPAIKQYDDTGACFSIDSNWYPD